jgi:hypothetical protein
MTSTLILIEDMFHPADATVPAIYNTAFSAVDPTNSGETSVNSLSRVLGTSSLPAATIDRVSKSNHLFVCGSLTSRLDRQFG